MTGNSSEVGSASPMVIAHRGARDVAPENTLAAFAAAISAGADGIELDVQACASGEIVVLHDSSVDRTTNGTGSLATMSFAALRRLDAGKWFSDRFAGERVPTLDEALDLAKGNLIVNIEIKGSQWRDTGVESKVARIVHAHDMIDDVLISSFNPTALFRIRRAAPELQRALLYGPRASLPFSRAWARRCLALDALHPQYTLISESFMRGARHVGYKVNAWTVNEPDDMRRMISLRVDGIITDHPSRLRALLAGPGASD